MIIRTIFSQRLKTLRLSHDLSGAALADLLYFKSQGSIANLEAGKSVPLADTIDRIADLFAVTLDWLVGRSDNSYDVAVLQNLEDHLLKKSRTLDDARLGFFRLKVCTTLLNSPYADKSTRSMYSMSVRANLIFAMQIFYYTSIRFYELHQTPPDEMNMSTVNRLLVPKLQKVKNGRGLWNLCTKCGLFWENCVDRDLYTFANSSNDILPLFDIQSVGEQAEIK